MKSQFESQKRYRERNRDKCAGFARKWRTDNPKKSIEIHKKYAAKNAEQIAAHSKLNYALSMGYIVRPDKCSLCGKECIPQGHHKDYSRPLEVAWLCCICHNKAHTIK